MTTAIKLPFECSIYDSEPVFVENPYSGQGCMLTPEAVAVYDVIKGAEMMGQYEIVRQGLGWFREHFPAEYMTLLD
jgi:bacillopeptidase F (M6 metalloprotease family)